MNSKLENVCSEKIESFSSSMKAFGEKIEKVEAKEDILLTKANKQGEELKKTSDKILAMREEFQNFTLDAVDNISLEQLKSNQKVDKSQDDVTQLHKANEKTFEKVNSLESEIMNLQEASNKQFEIGDQLKSDIKSLGLEMNSKLENVCSEKIDAFSASMKVFGEKIEKVEAKEDILLTKANNQGEELKKTSEKTLAMKEDFQNFTLDFERNLSQAFEAEKENVKDEFEILLSEMKQNKLGVQELKNIQVLKRVESSLHLIEENQCDIKKMAEEHRSVVKLVGGSDQSKGKPVCDDVLETNAKFANSFANVVCRMLGFNSGTHTIKSYFGTVSNVFSMDDVQCTGEEDSILDCTHTITTEEN